MTIPEEVSTLIAEEERILASVLDSLKNQQFHGEGRLSVESARARSLTARIVATRRDEEKQLLSSDEAVAHGLTSMKKKELEGIEKLLDKPYFARIVLDEQLPDGKRTSIEYKLGTVANVDCRIIDWRKAPISKLYYEYKEGDEYSEIIQGRERNGIISVRNKLEIEDGVLRRISCRFGDFVRQGEEWIALSGGFRSRSTASGETVSYQRLPSVLSLITGDQFRAITEDAKSAVLIQGVAGSGKTTVALHRLSWLLHEDNAGLPPKECLVVLKSKALRRYIELSLPELSLEDVPVRSYRNWLMRCFFGDVAEGQEAPLPVEPPGVRRVKRSGILLKLVEQYAMRLLSDPATRHFSRERAWQLVSEALRDVQALLDGDETRLFDAELIREAQQYTREGLAKGSPTHDDLVLVLCVAQLAAKHGGSVSGVRLPRLEHIVVDEVQDFATAELATLIEGVKDRSQLTLVGDRAQEVSATTSFPGWEQLRRSLEGQSKDGSDVVPQLFSLEVSHRSTAEVMRLADHVHGTQRTQGGRQGKPPLWYHCLSEDSGTREALSWVSRVSEKFPGTLAAVLCRSREEARYVATLFTPTFGNAVRQSDDADLSFDEGVLVADIRSVKGLEFPHVLLWNVSARNFPLDDRARNLLYVGITRAEEHLCLVSWKEPSPLLPSLRSKLVRSIVEEVEPKEEPESAENGGPWG